MPRRSDQSETARLLMLEQARRLKRLRMALGLLQGDAAQLAGVSRFAWRRYEGDGVPASITAVALGKFLAYKSLSADYVIAGNLAGLPGQLARDLLRIEADEGGHSPPEA